METKTLAFDVRDIEQFKEFFPDFKSGKMTGRELGSKLLELLKNQASNAATPSVQDEDEFKQLQHDFQELQAHCNDLEEQLAEQLASTTATPVNNGMQQDMQQEIQDTIQVNNELQDKLQNVQTDNQQLQEQLQDIQGQKKTLETQLQDLQDKNATLESRCKELKTQLKEAASHQDSYTFTPYFKQLIEVLAAKINEVSATNYSPADVIMQSLFATYFNSHTSIRYTYPITRAELLALAQQYYPELKTEKELFNRIIYKVKEE